MKSHGVFTKSPVSFLRINVYYIYIFLFYSDMGQNSSKESSQSGGMKFLVYGRSGWIGGLVGALLKEQGIPFEYGKSRLEDRRGIEEDIRRVR